MFSRFAKLLRHTALKPLIAGSIATLAYNLNRVRLEEEIPNQTVLQAQKYASEANMLKKIVEKQVCQSSDIN